MKSPGSLRKSEPTLFYYWWSLHCIVLFSEGSKAGLQASNLSQPRHNISVIYFTVYLISWTQHISTFSLVWRLFTVIHRKLYLGKNVTPRWAKQEGNVNKSVRIRGNYYLTDPRPESSDCLCLLKISSLLASHLGGKTDVSAGLVCYLSDNI